MFQLKGKNKMGDIESIILDEKNMSEAVVYAKKYFIEVLSIKKINLNEGKQPEDKELRNF